MRYALKSDYEKYTNVATINLPSDINRKLNRAEELIAQVVRSNGEPKQREVDTDIASGQKDISVLDANMFSPDDKITILDDNNSETGIIDSITINSRGSDTITLVDNLINSYTEDARAFIKITNPSDQNLKDRVALQKATCAQVEYWESMGESYDITGPVSSFAIGNLRMSYSQGGSGSVGGSPLAPRAYRILLNFGLLYAGVGNRSSTVQDFIAGDSRIN